MKPIVRNLVPATRRRLATTTQAMRLGLLSAAVLAVFGMAAPAAAQTVKIDQGVLHGGVDGKVEVFKGIPYAKAPVGDLRWRPPQPAAGWSGVRDATAPGASCFQQSGSPFGVLPYVTAQSEDCLFLNVWKPAGAKSGAKLPVMVWIHGGGFTVGTGSAPHYNGTHFAEHGVVLVNLNYRLGRFGFFAHPALTAENPAGPLGNYGVMDMIAALKWVRANIAAFGGDPANVTVFGESAGGIAINILMTSPQAKGLFVRAISESGFAGNALPPIRGDAPRTGEGVGLAFARSAGVEGAGPEALKALRGLTPQQLAAAPQGPAAGGLATMIDGVIVTESPMAAFAAGHEAKVPYIAGGNSFEASLFPEARTNPQAVLARAGPVRDQLLAVYGGDPVGAAQDFITESNVIEPDRAVARLHARNGQKAWVYYYSFVTPSLRATTHGLRHGGEIPYVFHTLSDHAVSGEFALTPPATAEDLSLSDKTIAYWTAFARDSDPDSAGGVAWPRFEPSTETVMEFGAGGPKATPQFHKQSLDLLEQLAARH